ncbi:MAG TPA: serine hydrolase [Longimicrobiales bacterium]|nr:serine hydrolase [Longimicrobiales bacterium]
MLTQRTPATRIPWAGRARLVVGLGALLAAAPDAAAQQADPTPTEQAVLTRLEAALRARVAAEPTGEVGVALVDLATGRRLAINGDVSMHAASTMKVPVLIELFRQVDAGRFAADDSVVVNNQFTSIADGSRYTLGSDRDTEIIERLGQTMSLRRLATGMSVISSNLATNILIDVVTADSVQATMVRLGAGDMIVLRGVSDNPAFAAGMNNMATAASLARTLEVIARCEIHSQASCDAMLEILEAQQFRTQIPAGVPAGVRVANKTGSITGHRHDGAIVFPDGRAPYVLTVLTRGIATTAAANAVAVDISRLVWEALTGAP